MEVELIGVSRNIEKIRQLVEKVTDTDINVLIHGETGVGKEVVAQELYRRSNRYGKPFVKVNCAALPDTLLESEMFGYERGAFTGAHKKMRGKFAQAHGGILFLDEIGDMSLSLQSKLLHVLQDGSFSPLGSEFKEKSNAWVIAATNHDLQKEVGEGKFREDLYYRLSCVTIHIKPLRERPEDLPFLIDYYAARYNAKFAKKEFRGLNNRVTNKLLLHQWPGNVRELQNVLKRLVVVGDQIDNILDLSVSNRNGDKANDFTQKYGGIIDHFGLNNPDFDWEGFSLKKISKEARRTAERVVISHVLEQTGWNRMRAQKILEISYKTLLNKIEELNLTPPKI
jgi:transcriptional regulator with PAS, ATPase and Fis domain